jgi:hypothetical protein
MGMAAVAWIEHVFGNLARPTDGLKEGPLPPDILAAHAPVAELVDAQG